MARRVGPISSSAQLANSNVISAAPSLSRGVFQISATFSSHFCGGLVAASSSPSFDPK
ncbi:Uncharacterised protein [Mycobacterium tuberculosis]|nr:Uncharacterised protein [Mycobacterium tuberculosis]